MRWSCRRFKGHDMYTSRYRSSNRPIISLTFSVSRCLVLSSLTLHQLILRNQNVINWLNDFSLVVISSLYKFILKGSTLNSYLKFRAVCQLTAVINNSNVFMNHLRRRMLWQCVLVYYVINSRVVVMCQSLHLKVCGPTLHASDKLLKKKSQRNKLREIMLWN